jgi:acetyl esterase
MRMKLWCRSRSRRLQVRGQSGPLPATLMHDGESPTFDTLVVFLHAGNFLSRSFEKLEEIYDGLSESIDSLGMLIPSYTLATVRPFPAALEDTVSALNWATENRAKMGWSGKRLVVAGIEAGANLAAASALACRDRKGPSIDGQVLLFPMLDPTFASRSMQDSTATAEKYFAAHRSTTGFQSYLPNLADRTHPYATPLHSGRLDSRPPALILSADGERARYLRYGRLC